MTKITYEYFRRILFNISWSVHTLSCPFQWIFQFNLDEKHVKTIGGLWRAHRSRKNVSENKQNKRTNWKYLELEPKKPNIVIFCGYFHKLKQIGWLNTTDIYYIGVPEARSLKSKCQQDHDLPRSSGGNSLSCLSQCLMAVAIT